MSRRGRGRGNYGGVVGPTSALTSFLREQGITNTLSYHNRRQQQQQQRQAQQATDSNENATGDANADANGDETQAEASSSANLRSGGDGEGNDVEMADVEEEENAQPAASSSRKRKRAIPEIDEDEEVEEDEDGEGDEEDIATSSKKQKGKGKATPKGKGKGKAAQKGKKKKKKGDSDDEDFEPEVAPKPSRYADRRPGSFAICGECGKKFTITKYTPLDPHPLCPACQAEASVPNVKGSGASGNDKNKPKMRRTAKVGKRAVGADGGLSQRKQVRGLAEMCIQLIGDNLDSLEDPTSLSTLGLVNMDNICRVVSRHRKMNPHTLKLFLDPNRESLRIFDCTELDHQALSLIPSFCPHLNTLQLNMCGRFDSDTLRLFAAQLPLLNHISLYGPHLVTATEWKSFLQKFGGEIKENDTGDAKGKKKPKGNTRGKGKQKETEGDMQSTESGERQLKGFMLRHSARFDLACVKSLALHCPTLTELRLSELGRLNDNVLKPLYSLKHLTFLDISRAGDYHSLTDDGVVPLLENIGENLVTLTLDGNEELTDRTLIEGIRIHCPKLKHLSLQKLTELLPTGIIGLFTDWANGGLTSFDVERCLQLDGESVKAVINHSGHSLLHVNLNSVDKEVKDDALAELAKGVPGLETLDVSFVRSADDFFLKTLFDNCRELRLVKVYGCNRVTDMCPSKAGVKVMGQEMQKDVEY